MSQLTIKQRNTLFSLLREGFLNPVTDGAFVVLNLDVAEASRLITIGLERREKGVMGFGSAEGSREALESQKGPETRLDPQQAHTGPETRPGRVAGPYRKGEHTTFEFFNADGRLASEIKIVHEGDRLHIRTMTHDLRLYVDGLTVLPHGDNCLTLKPRTRTEQGLGPHE